MAERIEDFTKLNDTDLIVRLERSVQTERKASTDAVAHLVEFDRRKLYAEEGYYSLFLYCTQQLGYSEHAAYQRMVTARTARRFPQLVELLEAGALHMNAVVMIAPHLMDQNFQTLVAKARGKSRRELEFLLASLAPQPDKADYIRPVAETAAQPGESSSAQAEYAGLPATRFAQSVIEPTSPGRVRFAFSGSEALLRKLERVRQLLRHKYPEGNLEQIIEDALDCLLDKIDPERRIQRKEQRASRRREIPQEIKDLVWKREGGRCAFVGTDGKRCPERGMLEFDHIRPSAMGGPSDDPANIRLLCRTHNQMFARRMFGEEACGPIGRDDQRRQPLDNV